MGLKVVTPPEIEPIDTLEAKEHLRITHNNEDNVIDALIATAREVCEKKSNRSLMEKTLKLTFNSWPEFPVELPRPPLIEVVKIEYKNSEGTLIEWDSANYEIDDSSFIPKTHLASDYDIPSDELSNVNAIQITYKAGYSIRDNIPARYKHAIKLLVGEWYNNREQVVNSGAVPQSIPDGVDVLLGLDRVVPT